MTVTARWNGALVAESDRTILVEDNHYFPPEDVMTALLEPSATTTRCPWKGEATYDDLVVFGERNADAAWRYDDPLPSAENIRGYIAFWHGVEVAGENPGEAEIIPPAR